LGLSNIRENSGSYSPPADFPVDLFEIPLISQKSKGFQSRSLDVRIRGMFDLE
jgi:hypothetical protein